MRRGLRLVAKQALVEQNGYPSLGKAAIRWVWVAQTQELTSRHIRTAPNIALPMANTTIIKLTIAPGVWVCVIQPKTMDSRFNATISQKSGLRGWYKRLSFMSVSVPGEQDLAVSAAS